MTSGGALGSRGPVIQGSGWLCGDLDRAAMHLATTVYDRLLPEPPIRAPGAPAFSRATVTSQPGRRMVYVLAYLPESRGAGVNMIEEPLELNDFSVGLRLDGRVPRRAYLAPSREELAFDIDGSYATVTIPRVCGWAMVVFEE